MRRLRAFIVVLGFSLVAGSHDSSAAGSRCEYTHCGWFCATHGSLGAGYCHPAEELTTGCIQLYGPDCASMANAYCCTRTIGAL